MTAKQQDPRQTDLESPEHKQFLESIGRQIMQTLGRPPEPHYVQVRKLWGECYRVNVLTGPEAAFARIAHSYFLTVDGQGTIVSAMPAVTKQY